MATVARFEIGHTGFIDPQGNATQSLPAFAFDGAALIPMYQAMVLTQLFDAKIVAMRRTGQLGTIASSLGAEAIGVGLASAMSPEDVLSSYRGHAAQLLRGIPMTEVLLFWDGHERGSDFAVARHDFPNAIPIASQLCDAACVAYASKLRGKPRVAVCTVREGTTSKGDFYEGINLAGVWQAPLVIVVNNNRWAISMPRRPQTAGKTLAQKAIAAGIESLQVYDNEDADIDGWPPQTDTTARLIRALVAGCIAEPVLNAWHGSRSMSTQLIASIDVGAAIHTPHGLLVAVLRNAADLGPDQLRESLAKLHAGAVARTIRPEDLGGNSITLSNFGTIGGRYAVRIVVLAIVAILNAGRARKQAVAVGDTVTVHRMLPLGLPFDHRAVAGAPAAWFLVAVSGDLERNGNA